MHVLLSVALGLLLLAETTSACELQGEPWLELRITASEYAGADRTLRVALHDNGCAHIRRPAYFRSPGDYRVVMDAASRDRFAQLASSPALATFDAQAIRAGIAQRMAGNDGAADTLFEVADAGRFELMLRDGGRYKQLQFDGVPQFAERFPDLPGITDFNAVVAAAHVLAEHPQLRPAATTAAGAVR
ncbi:MAG: hypothetical protein ACT4NL_08150 [Pseudomarimonas sp.]